MEFFNNNAGPTTDRNLYIGAMSHTVVTTGDQTITNSASVTRTGEGGLTDGLPDSWWGTYFPDCRRLGRV